MSLNTQPPAAPDTAPQAVTEPGLNDLWRSAAQEQRTAEPAVPEPVAETAPPAAEPEIPQAANEPISSDALGHYARSMGLNVRENATAEEVLAATEQRLRFLESQRQQAEPEPEPKPAFDATAHFKQRWQTREWEPRYDAAVSSGMVRQDEQGRFVPAEGLEYMAPLAAEMNEAQSGKRQNWQRFIDGNPYSQMHEALLPAMQHQWNADIEARIEARLAAIEQERRLDSFERENAGWMFQQGPAGNAVATPKGEQFFQVVGELERGGMNRMAAIEMAKRFVNITPEPAAPPTTIPMQKPAATAAAPVQPAAAAPPPAPEQKSTFLQDAMERAAHRPASSGPAPQADPGIQSQSDLNNVFRIAHRQSAG